MRRILKSCLVIVVAIVVLIAATAAWVVHAFTGIPFNSMTRHTRVPITPAWAFEPWVWEDDTNTADFVRELLDGYKAHDIPAQTILIDSPWSTRYNDFIVDEERYPNPAQFFGDLEAEGINVVLWMTCMVDDINKDTAIKEDRPWFDEAKSKGYLAGDGFETGWWKGHGGFIDYSNPEAMTWWRGMQQQVFDWGIDGWKLDGTATFFSSRPFGIIAPVQNSAGGWMTTREYMDHYYRDEYQHGLTQNPDFVTLARSYDGSLHPEGFAPFDAAPVTWVGDQDHTWTLKEEGFEEALTYIKAAADLGYNVIGSDVAGYSGGDIPANLYIRWAQFSTFCGLFLNGGHGERRLWMRSDEELEIIRRYAWLHSELVPYMYSYSVKLHNEGGAPLMQFEEENFGYRFGDALFVSPIFADTTDWTVALPEGTWHNLFDLTQSWEGPTSYTGEFTLEQTPAYIREGAIIPMHVQRDYTGFGDEDSAGYTTLLIVPGQAGAFALYDGDDPTIRTDVTLSAEEGGARIEISGEPIRPLLRVYQQYGATGVTRNGATLPTDQWTYDAEHAVVIIRGTEAETDVTYWIL